MAVGVVVLMVVVLLLLVVMLLLMLSASSWSLALAALALSRALFLLPSGRMPLLTWLLLAVAFDCSDAPMLALKSGSWLGLMLLAGPPLAWLSAPCEAASCTIVILFASAP